MALARLDIDSVLKYADEEDADLLKEIGDRKASVQTEMDNFALLCDRFDNLYFPADVLDHAGASHWANHPSATTPGKSHISINTPPVYVDIPASLQSVPPVENMVALIPEDSARQIAAMTERLYFAWKDEESFELKAHQACVVKGLYGRTAAKVYWDDQLGRPTLRVVDQPRNLYLGWGTSDYTRLDWALYTYRQSAEGVYEDWGLRVERTGEDGMAAPIVLRPSVESGTVRWLYDIGLEVEVFDYWYRRPKGDGSRDRYGRIQMETWNCIFVGNIKVKEERHAEYDGMIPYVPLFNTYIPGVPDGRPELYDVESLLREKDERLTQGSQLLNKATEGQLFQLVGPEAPDVIPANAIPKPNRMAAPGPGNRVEKIDPWMPEFQLEAFLSRLDREIADVTGLNDLLRGLAPASVLSSSKAINALVANYEARIRIKRDLFYVWRREVWDMVSKIWASKTPALRDVLIGAARLDVEAPSLTPRDDMETAAMASNLVNSKLWSLQRGMDRVGVDDPESELDIIRHERTDASIFPADVQVMAQLMLLLRQLGFAPPEQAQIQAAQQNQSLANLRGLMGGNRATTAMNGPGEQPLLPPEAMPANTPEGQQVAGPPPPPPPAPGGTLTSQTLTQGGEASNRILSNTPVTPEGQ